MGIFNIASVDYCLEETLISHNKIIQILCALKHHLFHLRALCIMIQEKMNSRCL